MNVVRFIECVAFALRVKTGERNVDVKLTIAANKRALLDIGITEEEWQSLIELNQLRNQLAGRGVMLPDTEDLFQVPITRPDIMKQRLALFILSVRMLGRECL
jgi:hypothetical protein